MVKDLLLIFYSWFLLSLWQLIAIPYLVNWYKNRLVDRGWAWGRLATWLVIAMIIWFLAHLGIPINTKLGVWFTFIILLLLSWKSYQQNKKQVWSFIKRNRWLLLTEELLFLIGLAGLSLVRSFNPNILDLEKFMDAGLVVSYLNSSTLPAIDMWLAGRVINYYTFGHFLGSVVTHFWDLNIALSYNLMLGTICGLVLSGSFGVAANLIGQAVNKRAKLKPLLTAGLVGSFLVTLAGNTHAIWYWFKNRTFTRYWYPDATRFIENTIHEFPAYSFIVSDLHAHVWSLPIVLFFIVNVLIWLKLILTEYRRKRIFSTGYLKFSLLLGLLLGIQLMTSAWDMAIYSLLLAILGVILLLLRPKLLKALIIAAGAVAFSALVAAMPWWINFDSISEGVRLVTQRSPIWQLLVLWSSHVVISIVAVVMALKLLKPKKSLTKQVHLLLVLTLALTAWVLLILPELIYFKDIYPNHPRANTMFKLTFQAFVMMSLTGGWLAGLAAAIKFRSQRWLKLGLGTLLVLVIIAVGIYPYFGYRDYYLRFKDYQGLNGLQWLKQRHPGDYQAIAWLQQHAWGRPVIVEAVGESYTDFARVSTFTGLPTILGWRVHEWLWRGGFEIPGKRTPEVETIYQRPLSTETDRLLNQYQVKYIFVGDKEREAYTQIDEAGLKQLGRIVFQADRTYIIQL